MNFRFQPLFPLPFGTHTNLRSFNSTVSSVYMAIFMWNNSVCWSTNCKQLLLWEWEQMAAARESCMVLLQSKLYGIVPRFLLLLGNMLLKWRSFICKNETKSLTLAWSGFHIRACQLFPEMVIFYLIPEREELNVILTWLWVLVLLVLYL